MFNVFEPLQEDLDFLFREKGKDVLVNGSARRALIDNTNVNTDFDDKKITTLDEIKRGDLITYENGKWLILSEINGKRNSRYRGIIRKCNQVISIEGEPTEIIIGYDPMGRPIYETVPGESINIDCIVDKIQLSVDFKGAINIPDDKIMVVVQDNEQSNKLIYNTEFVIVGSKWKVVGISKVRTGLIELSCQKIQA